MRFDLEYINVKHPDPGGSASYNVITEKKETFD